MNSATRKRFLVAGAGVAALISIGTSAQAQVIATQALASAQVAPAATAGAPLAAPTVAPDDATTNEVQVTASRIDRKGFVAPTPTTVLTASDLQFGGETNLGQALADLPSNNPAAGQAGSRGTTNAGQNYANLRDLGVQRTLILIDGARPIATSTATDVFDLNMIPFALVDHVEVVTGGASAQWGSDAVAGVINIVMKKSLSGVLADVQYGGDFEGLGSQEMKANLAYGTGFSDGRGQFMIGGSYDQVHGVYPASLSPSGHSGLIPNPNYTATNGQPQGLFVTGLLNNNASTGGLITSGPLKGTNFGPNGTTSAFQYGQYGLLATSGALMVGGDPTARYFPGTSEALITPLTRENVYSRASYDLTNRMQLTVDFMFGHEQSDGAFWDQENAGNITISNTNPFLPAAIKTAMAADKITSFTLGRQNIDFGPISELLKIGMNGSFGQTWTWDAFYSLGQNQRKEDNGNQEITANFNNAVNAVTSPTTGLPICKIALTNPTTNCVPVNLFGQGSPSAAAKAYFEGDSISSTWFYQHEVAANLRGQPFSLWAGPVSIATGFEFRDEGVTGHEDPITQASGFVYNDATLSDGSYTVAEAYLETVVPLIRDLPLMKKLDFNGAVRVSDYSTSGLLDSWKIGLTDKVTDDFLLRGTVSHDVEAPNLNELYTQVGEGIGTIVNPLNNTSVAYTLFNGGNKNLQAELATTYTGGVTYQPHWIPGLLLSADYYNINITGAIGTVAAQTIVNQCYLQKIGAACAQITTVNGEPSIIYGTYINYSSYADSGVDLESDYAFSLRHWGVPGEFKTKWLTTYVNTLKELTGTTVTRFLGGAVPRWRSLFTAVYTCGPLDVDARVRYNGGGAYSLTETVNTNVHAETYLDLGVKWKLPTRQKMVVYADVNNVFNHVNAEASTNNSAINDYIGRTYDVGLKMAF
jgi:outer membrane receptor protein involved in Fe transport